MEELQQDLSALGDSVTVINAHIEAGIHNDGIDDEVKRNYEHIEIMLSKSHIAESGEDLSSFIECVQKAKTWLGV